MRVRSKDRHPGGPAPAGCRLCSNVCGRQRVGGVRTGRLQNRARTVPRPAVPPACLCDQVARRRQAGAHEHGLHHRRHGCTRRLLRTAAGCCAGAHMSPPSLAAEAAEAGAGAAEGGAPSHGSRPATRSATGRVVPPVHTSPVLSPFARAFPRRGCRHGGPVRAWSKTLEGRAHGMHRRVLPSGCRAAAPTLRGGARGPSSPHLTGTTRLVTAAARMTQHPVTLRPDALRPRTEGSASAVWATPTEVASVFLSPPLTCRTCPCPGDNTDEDCRNSCQVVFCPCHGFAGASLRCRAGARPPLDTQRGGPPRRSCVPAACARDTMRREAGSCFCTVSCDRLNGWKGQRTRRTAGHEQPASTGSLPTAT